LSDEKTVFVDASWHMNPLRDGKSEYTSERIRNAVYFDINDIADKSSDLPHMLPSAKDFGQLLGDLGISSSNNIVVYTSSNCFSAARAWWMFRAFHHKKVSILNGGLEAWKKAGGEVQTGSVSVEDTRPVGKFTAQLNSKVVASMDEVKTAMTMGTCQICDARSAERFNGIVPEPRAGCEGGHIPGALNLPFLQVTLDGDCTSFKSPDELETVFEDAGVIKSARVVFTCGSGVTAATLAFARHLTGVADVHSPVYDGSWSEWGSDPNTPKMK
jgi:thiosulfate/3-mercaptopyruvate sulfurtransferase